MKTLTHSARHDDNYFRASSRRVAQNSDDRANRKSSRLRGGAPARVGLRISILLILAGIAHAQVPGDYANGFADNLKPIQLGPFTLSGEVRGRGQGWDWFLGDTRVRYGFGDSLLRLGLAGREGKISWKIEVAQPSLYALPDNATLPGAGYPLGLGAIYFAANRNQPTTAGIFVKQAFVSIRGIDRNGHTLRLGRFEFSDGQEKTPAAADLAWPKQQRVAHRLIGDSYWTDIGRSFDGLHFSDNIGGNTNLTFVAGRATQGVWQTDGMGEMDVDVLYAAYTRELPTPHTASEVRVFAMGYHDGRRVLKVDNRPLAARKADTHNIRIGTFGLSYILVAPIPHAGKWDLLFWGARQIGQWGILDHRASSATAEIGWRPPIPWIHPWLRAGALYASGDGNPNDGQHTTYFQPLPTEQQYARLPFYTLQNCEDYTGQVIFQPARKLDLRAEVHKVKLHSINDLWYLGSGAFQNASFGYDGLPNNHHTGLGNDVDVNVDYRLTPHFGLRYYIGILSGKAAMTERPNGRKGGFTYLDLVYWF